MRSCGLVLLILSIALIAAGCASGPSASDKAASAAKFKQLNKNDVNHDATP